MTTIKTAVSIEDSVFERAEQVAEELEVSRSFLYTLALQNFIAQYDSRRITEILNEVYADGPTVEETQYLEAMWHYHVQLIKDDPW